MIAWMAARAARAAARARTPAGTLRERLAERMAERHAADSELARNPILASGPFELPRGAVAERDIAYGADPAQRLDVYRPVGADGAPVIFMAHGGGWMRGDKALWRSVKNKVAHWVDKGYVLVSVNYRLLPQTRPLEQADDVAMALAFAQHKAAAWGGDGSRFVLMGHSAGAHLMSLIATDPGIGGRAGAKPWLATVTIDSAAFDLVQIMRGRHFGFYDRAFGDDPGDWRDASPIHRLASTPSAPWLAVCSSQRADPCAQAQAFSEKVMAMGGRVHVLPVDLSHADLNDLLGTPGDYTDAVVAFMHSVGLP